MVHAERAHRAKAHAQLAERHHEARVLAGAIGAGEDEQHRLRVLLRAVEVGRHVAHAVDHGLVGAVRNKVADHVEEAAGDGVVQRGAAELVAHVDRSRHRVHYHLDRVELATSHRQVQRRATVAIDRDYSTLRQRRGRRIAGDNGRGVAVVASHKFGASAQPSDRSGENGAQHVGMAVARRHVAWQPTFAVARFHQRHVVQ
mmetsp:Transcript_23083/g.56400  ORF Transcript_23083/g.56400 Transcript_23083/m.56400 type:complete len:201 (-) Transcript_23083:209-811(-)